MSGPDAVTLRSLLREADRFLGEDESRLPRVEGPVWGWFALGGGWMRATLEAVRAEPVAARPVDFTRLGAAKYALAGLPALLAAGLLSGSLALAAASVLVFYAAESRLVFLFPAAIDGSASPFSDSRRLAGKAGGPWRLMRIVMGLAAVMLLGGLCTGRFLRCWALGCAAVVLWYERTRD